MPHDPRAPNPFAPSSEVLAAVHDRARAAAAVARLEDDAELQQLAAAARAPLPAAASDRAEHAIVEVRPQRAPHLTASRVQVDADAVGVALPAGDPQDVTVSPRRVAAAARAGEAPPMSTSPGLGEPPPSSADETLPPADPPTPSASIDDAMRDAELRVAEAQNREFFEREKKRRMVDAETREKLKRVEKGSKEHFDALALRQKWTLPLDDEDYAIWRQQQMLVEHAQALRAEASHRRIEKAKAVARGPAIALGVVAAVGVLVGIGWWLGRGDTAETGSEVTSSSQASDAASAPARGVTSSPIAASARGVTSSPRTTAPEVTSSPVGEVTSSPPTGPMASPSATPPEARPGTSTPPASGGPVARPGSATPPAAAPPPTPPSAPAPKDPKDPWTREF